MITKDGIRSIIAQYKKFDWTFRRVLLSQDLENSLGHSAESVFAGVAIDRSDIDAAWFSRAALDGGTTWELRRLSALPYALVEVVPPETDEAELENIRSRIEDDLRERVNNRPQAA
jgi:hypothetical protein